MCSELLKPDIYELIEARNFAALKKSLCSMEIHRLFGLLEDLEGDDLAVCFRLLDQDRAGEILGDFEHEQQEELLNKLSGEKLTAILNEMPPDDRTELLEEMPGDIARQLLSTLTGEERKIARGLLAYPEDSIGRLMTPEYVAVRAGWTVEHVFAHIRKVARDKETWNVLYVVDDNWKLLDEVPLEEVILAEPGQKVEELMDGTAASLQAYEDQEQAIEMFKKYDAVALPVVNRKEVLVGIVTHDDVMDVQEEENTEDFQKMAGMAALEYSYFGTGFMEMLRKRLPWLIMLLAAQMMTTWALTSFHALPLFAILVVFMPLVNSPAGNTGSQMAGLMIRGLAVQEMRTGDWWRVMLREVLRGLALGVVLACMGFVATLLFGPMLATPQAPITRLRQIALAVAMAIGVAVTMANLVGAMLPFVFKRVGLDPAVTSGPFIASVMDVSGILIYFTIATGLLSAIT